MISNQKKREREKHYMKHGVSEERDIGIFHNIFRQFSNFCPLVIKDSYILHATKMSHTAQSYMSLPTE